MILRDNDWAVSFATARSAGGLSSWVCQQYHDSLATVGKLYCHKCGVGDFVSYCMVGKPWYVRSGAWVVWELSYLRFWPCFPCAQRDLPYKYTWNKQHVFSLVTEINETSDKILELHLKVNDEQVCQDFFYCVLVLWIKMFTSLMLNSSISEPGGQTGTWDLAKCSIYFC